MDFFPETLVGVKAGGGIGDVVSEGLGVGLEIWLPRSERIEPGGTSALAKFPEKLAIFLILLTRLRDLLARSIRCPP
jgi:hypothetical protein